jgi:N-acyl homoserine lactone hydrolase
VLGKEALVPQPQVLPTIEVLLPGYNLNSDAGAIGFCAVTLVEGHDEAGRRRRILVDPAHVGRRPVLWAALAERGLRPDDIDAIVLTHAHWDHIQNVDVFAHAPILLHPAEHSYSLAPHRNDWATPSWTGMVLERQPIVEVAEGDQLLPGVSVIDMPGHTPGSIGVSVETEGGLAVISGDALPRADIALSRTNGLIFWDAAQAKDSVDRVVDLADAIYPGHDMPFRVTREGEIEYLQPLRLKIQNVDPSSPGVEFETERSPQWTMPAIEEQAAAREAFKNAAQAAKQRRVAIEQEPDSGGLPWWERAARAGGRP